MIQVSAVLNRTQLGFLEQVISQHGTVVTYDEIAPLIPVQDELGKRQFVSRLAQAGWLVRIKKGVYQVAELTSLGTVTLSRYVVAQILAPGSYVSLETALQFHGLHDQLMQTAVSVALKQRRSAVVQGTAYQFIKTTDRLFFGYEAHVIDGKQARIATAEKALIDMVLLHRTGYTSDRVAEILAGSADQLDLDRLQHYLRQVNLTTQRIFGFLLDRLHIGYDTELAARAAAGQAASRLTPASTAYDARWHLYYDDSILERHAPA